MAGRVQALNPAITRGPLAAPELSNRQKKNRAFQGAVRLSCGGRFYGLPLKLMAIFSKMGRFSIKASLCAENFST